MTFEDQIINHIKNNTITPEQRAYRIIRDIQEKLDKKIELVDQEVLDPSFIAINDCMGCIQEKKKAYLEMKDLLRK